METNDFFNVTQQSAPKTTEANDFNAVQQKAQIEEETISSGAERTLITLANIILIFGILTTIIFAIISIYEFLDYEPDEAIISLTYAIAFLFGTLSTWSTMRVFANISITLKEILNKIK